VAVRFDPKTKYLMELAARVQRRSVANYVERAVEESLRNVTLEYQGTQTPITEVAEELWDVDEAERFYYLARVLPGLLTHDEQMVWKLIEEKDQLWGTKGGTRVAAVNAEFRHFYAAAKYAVGTGADIETVRAALAGDGAAVESIGLDTWAKAQRGEAVPGKKTRKTS